VEGRPGWEGVMVGMERISVMDVGDDMGWIS
jgi:hypothetical protein